MRGSTAPKRTHQPVQKQSKIMDQNYSNNIMLTTMSTIEEIAKAVSSQRSAFKAYGYYDKSDYSSKSIAELRSQLQLHLTIMKASRNLFDTEHGNNSFSLPSSYSFDRLKSQATKYQQIMEANGERQGAKMCDDLLNIIFKTNKSLAFESKSYSVPYSQKEASLHKKSLVKTGIRAQQIMDKEGEKIRNMNIINQQDLPVHVISEKITEKLGNTRGSSLYNAKRRKW